MPGTAWGEDPSSGTPAADSSAYEIVVTALRRSTTLEATPAAISAVTGDTLANMGIQDSQNLASVAPGLVIRESPFGGARITIRNIRSPGEATVGLYYDETPVIGAPGVTNDAGGTTPSVNLFDLDRAEVLRGPQGTLYGSGSMAGTVRLIYAKPELNSYEGMVDLQGTDMEHGSLGGDVQAMANMPLVDGKLAVRVVGFARDQSGYIDNDTLGLKNVNRQTDDGGRILLRYEPTSNLTFDLMAVLQDKKGWNNTWSYNIGAYDENYLTRQPMTDNMQIYSGTAKWDMGFASLTGVMSYSSRDIDYQYDASGFFTYVAALVPAGPVRALALSESPATAYAPQTTKVFTQELRLSSEETGPLQWTAGLFHFDRKNDTVSNVDGADGAGNISANKVYYSRFVHTDLEQTAGYGEATYSITDHWDVTGGARYYNYSTDTSGAVTTGNALLGSLASPASSYDTSQGGWLYKFNSSYRFTPDIMAYTEASEGFRPGGLNQVVGLPLALAPYKSDSLWNYEAGLKTEWLNRKLVVNADIFQIDWSNMQVAGTTTSQAFGSTFSFVSNAGNARIRGIEFDTSYEPIRDLLLQFSGSYMNAVLTSNQVNAVLAAPGVKGDAIPYAPDLTLQIGAQYGWEMSPGLRGMARADVDYSSDTWTQFVHSNAFQQKLPGFADVNLRAGITSVENDWTGSIFVKNLFNEVGLTDKGVTVLYGGTNVVRALSIAPRTIGVEFSKHF